MKTNKYLLLSAFLLSILLTGCIGVNSEFKSIRKTFFDNAEIKYKKEFEIGIGSLGLSLAGTIVKIADDEHEYLDDMIKEISSVQVGTYIIDPDDIPLYRNNMTQLVNKLREDDWNLIIKNISSSELNLVFVKEFYEEEDEEITLLVINVDNNETVIAEIEGNLAKVITYALKEKGFRVASNFD